jgi:hypothetical protein
VEIVAITFEFAARVELKKWAKMKLSKEKTLRRKVAEIEGTTIRVNFEFVD